MFWPLKNFWESSFKILDRDYKSERSNKHLAKFRADQPTELGDYARGKKKKLEIWGAGRTYVGLCPNVGLCFNVSLPDALSLIGGK